MYIRMEKIIKSFEYNPNLTAEEMAAASGLTVKQVQNRLQRLGYSHRQNKEKQNFEKVRRHLDENPNATPTEIASATGLSRPSVYKFMAMGETYSPSSNNKKSQAKIQCLSVGTNVHKVLRGIIGLHIPHSNTFECDLTFGEGGFYQKGIPEPKYIFDKFDYEENSPIGYKVEKLDLANPVNIKVNSVVIDLPITMGENAFESSSDLYETYEAYIEYANSILNKGGLLVFSTADFILRDDADNAWATDFAILVAMNMGFSLKDKIHLVRKGETLTIDGASVKSGLKDSAFLIFTKN